MPENGVFKEVDAVTSIPGNSWIPGFEEIWRLNMELDGGNSKIF